MTAPQPDTETTEALLVRVRLGIGHRDAHDALDALAARLAEAEAQRDDALLVREGLISPVQKVLELQRQVATLEAALDFTREAMDEILELEEPAAEIADVATSAARAVRDRIAALDSLPSHPAVSLTAEDAAYVARRATWERE